MLNFGGKEGGIIWNENFEIMGIIIANSMDIYEKGIKEKVNL
jgi:hypothetical protein